MQIEYTLKTEPYETSTHSRLGATTTIRDTKDMVIEFDFNQLSNNDKELITASLSSLSKNVVKLYDYELNEGTVPTKTFTGIIRFTRASVKKVDFNADTELSLEDALAHMRSVNKTVEMLEVEATAINEERRMEKARMQAELDEANEKRKLMEERQRKEKEAKLAKERNEAGNIEWIGNKTTLNLYEKIILVSGLDIDTRFTSWVKEVSHIDRSQKNGYSIAGDWVNNRTVEIDNRDKVYLAASTTGSRKYQTTHYKVVVLRDGKLIATDIETDNTDAGWALKIRDDIEALLNTGSEENKFAELREAVNSEAETVTVSRELLAQLLAQVS